VRAARASISLRPIFTQLAWCTKRQLVWVSLPECHSHFFRTQK
jgi:hypothetical protein